MKKIIEALMAAGALAFVGRALGQDAQAAAPANDAPTPAAAAPSAAGAAPASPAQPAAGQAGEAPAAPSGRATAQSTTDQSVKGPAGQDTPGQDTTGQEATGQEAGGQTGQTPPSPDPVVNQLELLRQQEADAEGRQESLEAQQAQRAAAATAALNTVGEANQAMAYGSEDVADALAQAATALTGPAQSYVQLAQAALDNGDLYTARQCLQSALVAASLTPASPNATPPVSP